MCGICAVLTHQPYGPYKDGKERLYAKKAFDTIKHRGPDNSHYEWVHPNFNMTFHRLAIMDTSSEGDQPIRDAYGDGNVLICNGEIYNFKALKAKYGFKTHSGSDCEVILDMYRQFGFEETLKQLVGVFAIVLYDNETGVIHFGRDRVGVRSMNYMVCGTGLYISSEIKTFTNLLADGEMNFDGVISADVACFSNVPPGHFTSIKISDFIKRLNDYRLAYESSDDDLSKDELSKVTPVFKPYYDLPSFDWGQHILDQREWGEDYFNLSGYMDFVYGHLYKLLRNAVERRMMSDRVIGCLLSGGLDSSTVTAMVKRICDQRGLELETFSIGFEGSPDLIAAREVANHLGTKHHEFVVTHEEMLGELDNVIYLLETWDTTTIRASIFNYVLCKKIRQVSEAVVIFNGDGSDEIFGSYQYMAQAPSVEEFEKENRRLVKDIHYYDVRRSDLSISANGLEARTPFLDIDLVEFVLKLPPQIKMHVDANGNHRMEKHVLRKAIELHGDNLLPESVLWRYKEAFSDGVSDRNIKSWFQVLQEHIEVEMEKLGITNENLSGHIQNFVNVCCEHSPPRTLEELYYRKMFCQYHGDALGYTESRIDRIIPGYWMPKWCGDVVDPSARMLEHYKD